MAVHGHRASTQSCIHQASTLPRRCLNCCQPPTTSRMMSAAPALAMRGSALRSVLPVLSLLFLTSQLAPAGAHELALTSNACAVPSPSSPSFVTLTDSSGRHTFDMGNYAQCVGGGFQYCLITVAGAVPFASCVPADCSQAIVSNMTSPIWEYIWALNPLAFALAEATSNVYPVSVVCGDNKQPMTAGRGVFIGFLVTLGAVILAATGIVVHQRYCVRASGRKPEKPPAHKSLSAKLLDCFALTSSVPSMLATGGDRSGHLSSLNGVRVFSMSLVILGHTLIFQALVAIVINYAEVEKQLATAVFQVIPSAEFAVDSFFLMSGFLASYLFLVQLARKLPHWRGAWCFASDHAPPVHVSGSDEHGEAAHARPPRTGAILCASLGFYVFHRFWRLTPMVLMGIALFVVIAPLMGSGPFWQWAYTVETCSKYWWTNALFINNFVPDSWNGNFAKECIGWTWYLANDTQLYLLAPIFILTFLWRPLAGTALTAITLLAALVAGEEIVRQNHINFKSADLPADTGDMSDLYYTKPWARCPPYLLGILLAFLYYRHAQRKMAADKLAAKQAELLSSTTQPTSDVHSHSVSNKNASAAPWSPFPTVWWSWLLWACALVLMGVIFYVGADSYSTPTRAGWSTGSIVFYTAFSRTLWSAGLGCMLYLCFIGEGGAIGAFLSWKVWEPLAKLTFGAYIMHPVIISVVYMRSTQPLYFDYYTIFTLFYGFSALSYMAAAALFVSVEVPLAQVEKYFIRPLLGVAPTHQHHAPPPPHKAHAESQCTPLCKVVGVTSLNTQYEPLASVLTMNPSSSAATDDWRRSRDVQPNASLSTPFLPA